MVICHYFQDMPQCKGNPTNTPVHIFCISIYIHNSFFHSFIIQSYYRQGVALQCLGWNTLMLCHAWYWRASQNVWHRLPQTWWIKICWATPSKTIIFSFFFHYPGLLSSGCGPAVSRSPCRCVGGVFLRSGPGSQESSAPGWSCGSGRQVTTQR